MGQQKETLYLWGENMKKLLLIILVALAFVIAPKQESYAWSYNDYLLNEWTVSQLQTKYWLATSDTITLDFYDFAIVNTDQVNNFLYSQLSTGGTTYYSKIDVYNATTSELIDTVYFSDFMTVGSLYQIMFGSYFFDYSEHLGTPPESINIVVSAVLYVAADTGTSAGLAANYIGLFEDTAQWQRSYGTNTYSLSYYNAGYQDAITYYNNNPDELSDWASIYNTAYQKGYDAAVAAGDNYNALVKFPGAILGTFLSYFLFIGTEFDIFGVTLVGLLIVLFAFAATAFVFKKVFG